MTFWETRSILMTTELSSVFQPILAMMVSIILIISDSSKTFAEHLVTVPSNNNNWYHRNSFIFSSFFKSFLVKFKYLSIFLLSFIFPRWFARTAKSSRRQVLSFLLLKTRSTFLLKIWWSVCISKYQRILRVSFSRTNSSLCIYHVLLWSDLNLLRDSQWIAFPPVHLDCRFWKNKWKIKTLMTPRIIRINLPHPETHFRTLFLFHSHSYATPEQTLIMSVIQYKILCLVTKKELFIFRCRF